MGAYTIWCDTEGIAPEIDPWGGYMQDGIPALWLRQTVTSSQLLKRLNAGAELPGPHCYFDNEQWAWEIVPVKDLSVRMVNLLFKENFGTGDECLAIMHRIGILGRRRKSLQDEIRHAYSCFKKLKL